MDETAEPSAELITRLDRIADLLALTLVRRLNQGEQIRILASVGYQPARIADFLGIKANTVSASLYRQRKARE